MKKKLLHLLYCLLLLSAVEAGAQQYYIVNNQPGSQAAYHSLQAAVDSVPSGSIILLQPSGTDYGNITVTRPMVIYGAGYFLGENASPFTQTSTVTSRIRFIRFTAGAAGSSISGIHFTRFKTNTDACAMFDTTSNVTVSRCYFENFPGLGQGSVPRFFDIIASTNITIQQNFLATNGPSGWIDAVMYTAYGVGGILYRNNIITGGGRLNAFSSVVPEAISFVNNVITNSTGERLNGNSFYNNIIIYTQDPNLTDPMNSASSNNISNRAVFPNASANTVDTSLTISKIFIAASTAGVSSSDGFYQLRSGTAAAGYGNDGKDAGAFGGAKPYVLSGIPAIPHFYSADVSEDATKAGGLKLSLKVKANQ